jgi:hypothetical protein
MVMQQVFDSSLLSWLKYLHQSPISLISMLHSILKEFEEEHVSSPKIKPQ